jgi:hypothetical protein
VHSKDASTPSKAAIAQQELHARSRAIAKKLLETHRLSTRDAAELMGISQQRVAQLGADG